MGMSRVRRVLAESEDAARFDLAEYESALGRLLAGEPLAHVLGEWPFRENAYRVSPAVLIPRPETEVLVDLALGALAAHPAPKVLDLGTGSGCIAIEIALAREDASVTAVDVSAAALDVAADNAARLGAERVRFVRSDWYAALGNERFDLIVANPPYVAEDDPHLPALRHEPAGALVSGADGLDALRAIVLGAPGRLQGPAWLGVEHGFDQSEAVQALFRSAGFTHPQAHTDLAGIPRAVCGRLSVSVLNG
jgi:release factor glutamine methyltransferase